MPTSPESPRATRIDCQYVHGALQAHPALRSAELVDGVVRVTLTNLQKDTTDYAHALLEGRGISCPVEFVSIVPHETSISDMINALPCMPPVVSDASSDTPPMPHKPAA
jgi:hypothetical protein